MAVALNNAQTTSTTSLGGTTVSLSYTTSSGANRLLMLDVSVFDSSSRPTSATYAGVSMASQGGSSAASHVNLDSFSLVAPATGSNTMAATFSSYQGAAQFSAADFTGVDQSTPVGTVVAATGSSSSPSSGSVTLPSNGYIWGSGSMGFTGGPAPTAGSGCTLAGAIYSGGTGFSVASATRTTTGAISFSISGSTAWAVRAFPINSASSSTAYSLTCAAGSYSVSGKAATLTYTPGGSPINYTLTCAVGSYALSGKTATLTPTFHRTLACAVGSYSVIGQSATFASSGVAYNLSCAAGSYSVSGKAATLTYTPSGTTTHNYTLACNPGVYAITGQPVQLRQNNGGNTNWYPRARRLGLR